MERDLIIDGNSVYEIDQDCRESLKKETVKLMTHKEAHNLRPFLVKLILLYTLFDLLDAKQERQKHMGQ